MGFKTEYKDITLKDFLNLTCFARSTKVRLTDYHSDAVFERSIEIDNIPERFSDYYVEFISTWPISKYDHILNITIRENI